MFLLVVSPVVELDLLEGKSHVARLTIFSFFPELVGRVFSMAFVEPVDRCYCCSSFFVVQRPVTSAQLWVALFAVFTKQCSLLLRAVLLYRVLGPQCLSTTAAHSDSFGQFVIGSVLPSSAVEPCRFAPPPIRWLRLPMEEPGFPGLRLSLNPLGSRFDRPWTPVHCRISVRN